MGHKNPSSYVDFTFPKASGILARIMSTDPKQYNLQELVTGLAASDDPHSPPISEDMKDLLKRGLHHVFLPPTLQPKAAEASQLAFEGIGGVARYIQWADRNPGKFYALHARMIPATIAPVLPTANLTARVWPEWMTARRLRYQEEIELAQDIASNDTPAPAPTPPSTPDGDTDPRL